MLIALAVIVLPLLLDGRGSESKFRRVEQLREEPPRVRRADGSMEADTSPEMKPVDAAGRDPLPEIVDTPPSPSDTMQVWVVQAGSFSDVASARAVRDRLRGEGYPSFILTVAVDGTEQQRVEVGPMVSRERAEETREAVAALLGRDVVVRNYP
ncbi:MAG: hypothetical protein CSA54_03615 [Gammaproteobacteria bacterium]|nr:MAG: hypothetical protein CSA54_03615 [Gammaproteobacteria bacterium]